MLEWSFFNKIYCINLIERNDRYEHIKKISNEYNMNINFYRTERNKNSGEEGCFYSHISVIKDAFKNNYDNIIILEDDLQPFNITQKRINDVVNFIKHNDFDIFYIGICPDIRKNENIIFDKKSKIYSIKSLGAHAYILNKKSIKKFYNISYEGTAIDVYYNNNCFKSYGIYPSLFYQFGFTSDITHGFNVHNKISPKLIKNYTTFMEKYCFYIGWSLYKLLCIIIIFSIITIILKVKFLFFFLFFIILIFIQIIVRLTN